MRTLSPARLRLRSHQQGFTLVEVFVALSAGVLVSMAAFMLSKNATTFFQNEARISATQLSLTVGLNRIVGDLQRAAFLSTRNIVTDPAVCRSNTGGWTTGSHGLQELAGIQITQGTASTEGSDPNNGIRPDQIIIGGSMDSSEVFQVQCVQSGVGGAPRLDLQTPQYDNGLARLLATVTPLGKTSSAAETIAAYTTALQNIFVDGRFVNLFDPSRNMSVYGVIAVGGLSVSGTDAATASVRVQLAQVPTVPVRAGTSCGIDPMPNCRGNLLLSVVSRVKYAIRSLQSATLPAGFSGLVASVNPAQTGDNGRTELVRVELDAQGGERTPELVAEYAIDLRFGVTVATLSTLNSYDPTKPNYNPGTKTYPFGADNTVPPYTVAGPIALGGTTAAPDLIRSVMVRLATRTRAPDRMTALPKDSLDNRMLRFFIPGVPGPQYARVRTNYANVSLPNQAGFSLPTPGQAGF